MELSEQTIGAIIALSGVLVGGLFTFLGTVVVTWIRERNESRRQLVKMAFDSASNTYQNQFELVKVDPTRDHRIKSFMYFFLFDIALFDRLSRLRGKNPDRAMSELKARGDYLEEWTSKY